MINIVESNSIVLLLEISSAEAGKSSHKGKINKLEEVEFVIPKDEAGNRKYLEPWTVNSADGRLKASFAPILDRSNFMDFKVIISDQHQVFGRLSGTVTMDDGETVNFKDFICALEVVRNKY